jgi:hypothetical protein
MKLCSLYRDFFIFLEKIPSSSKRWNIYLSHYYQIHQEFLDNYFSHFHLIDSLNLKQRVEAIRASDYSWLKHLVSVCPPEGIINEAYERCIRIVPTKEEPEVYLFVGFFSPDGFVINFRAKPIICFGLERFRDFKLLRVLFAHEYAHFLLNLCGVEIAGELGLKWRLISEGIATYFSFLVFPKNDLSEHFLLSLERFNWCQANESYLREIYFSGKFSIQRLMEIYVKGAPELDVPPRAGKYLGFQAVQKYVDHRTKSGIKDLLSDRKKALALEL